jgi:hypothetical protein
VRQAVLVVRVAVAGVKLVQLVRVVEAVVGVGPAQGVDASRAVADEALEAAEVGQASGSEARVNETGTAEHVHSAVRCEEIGF